jgi:flagellar basal-body rod modification protein FlgD
MTNVTPAASTTGTGAPQAAEPTNPNGLLEQNDFLKLMVAQLKEQNPLQPEGNTNEYLTELTNFTQVEQITNLALSSELTGAVQLMGHEVTYDGASGKPERGTVESVQSTSSGTTLTISGVSGISESSITEVAGAARTSVAEGSEGATAAGSEGAGGGAPAEGAGAIAGEAASGTPTEGA